jgi:ketosteroid isomerase-like protein
MQPLSPLDPTHVTVRDWIAAWGGEVADVALEAARKRIAPDVVSFGTHADVVYGIDALFEQQWSKVWPAIEGFRCLVDDLVVLASDDHTQAVAVVGWDSTGFAADGSRFTRPGRATVVLARADATGPWLGTHTHFSLGRDVPAATHGPPSEGE